MCFLLLPQAATQISGVGRLFDEGKKGGLQPVFAKFSLGLKGQQGPFFAKQERKQSLCGDPAKFSFSLIFQKLAEGSPALTGHPALLKVLERVGLDHLQGPALQAEATPSWGDRTPASGQLGKKLSLFY